MAPFTWEYLLSEKVWCKNKKLFCLISNRYHNNTKKHLFSIALKLYIFYTSVIALSCF